MLRMPPPRRQRAPLAPGRPSGSLRGSLGLRSTGALRRVAAALAIVGALASTGCLAQEEGGAGSDGGTLDDRGTLGGDASALGDGGGPDRALIAIEPPRAGTSRGSGGGASPAGGFVSVGAVQYVLIVPSGYRSTQATPLVIVVAGSQGATSLASALLLNTASVGPSGAILAVVDSQLYLDAAGAAAQMLDDVRARYNIDNDRTYLLGDAEGVAAAFELGLQARQSWFAALWGNDLVAVPLSRPARSAAQVGVAPWANISPGGLTAFAIEVLAALRQGGYRLPEDAPYSGRGATTRGSAAAQQAALQFFANKVRQ
ncbi:MAG: hypothetical protein IPL40_06235 [Proteobacteria bacterium]|nr:hypothetical protein [Pseudomonadota bacterium]